MAANHRETPVETLERWEHHGATWRAVHVSDAKAVVDLCTCHGEPVERIESSDPALIRLLRERAAAG
ncbi:MAG: hypothetical protein QOH76_593 [Thermoleophilaceae bacterium]|jgi:hypothetical protein|nr:hypothetical protein [Thermoleophilaceae bacterium]